MDKDSVSESDPDVCERLLFFCLIWNFCRAFPEAALSSWSLWGTQCPLHRGEERLKPAASGRRVQRAHSKTGLPRGKKIV